MIVGTGNYTDSIDQIINEKHEEADKMSLRNVYIILVSFVVMMLILILSLYSSAKNY